MIVQHLLSLMDIQVGQAQFVISAINITWKFSPLRFKIEDMGEKEANTKK